MFLQNRFSDSGWWKYSAFVSTIFVQYFLTHDNTSQTDFDLAWCSALVAYRVCTAGSVLSIRGLIILCSRTVSHAGSGSRREVKLLLCCGPTSIQQQGWACVCRGYVPTAHVNATCVRTYTDRPDGHTEHLHKRRQYRRPHPAPLACREGLGPLAWPVPVQMENAHPVDNWGHLVCPGATLGSPLLALGHTSPWGHSAVPVAGADRVPCTGAHTNTQRADQDSPGGWPRCALAHGDTQDRSRPGLAATPLRWLLGCFPSSPHTHTRRWCSAGTMDTRTLQLMVWLWVLHPDPTSGRQSLTQEQVRKAFYEEIGQTVLVRHRARPGECTSYSTIYKWPTFVYPFTLSSHTRSSSNHLSPSLFLSLVPPLSFL